MWNIYARLELLRGQPSSDDHPSKSDAEDGKKCSNQEKNSQKALKDNRCMGLLGALLPTVHRLNMNVVEQGGLELSLLDSLSEYRHKRETAGGVLLYLRPLTPSSEAGRKRGFRLGLQREFKSTSNFQLLLGWFRVMENCSFTTPISINKLKCSLKRKKRKEILGLYRIELRPGTWSTYYINLGSQLTDEENS